MNKVSRSIVNAGIDKATKEFTQRLHKTGFNRSKKWLWVRRINNSADFIHLHRDGSSYGGVANSSVSFTVHCGRRQFNDSLDFLHLNGPNSKMPEYSELKFHHRFNAKSGSTYERCIEDLVRFVLEIGEAWFNTVVDEKPQDEVLENVLRSYKLLGIKKERNK